jgi:hypothetical protein
VKRRTRSDCPAHAHARKFAFNRSSLLVRSAVVVASAIASTAAGTVPPWGWALLGGPMERTDRGSADTAHETQGVLAQRKPKVP